MKKLLVVILLFSFNFLAHAQFYHLVWSDEFTNEISSDWNFDIGTGVDGWGNKEQQYYKRENATCENGALVITAKYEDFGGEKYTSARMITAKGRSFKYGKIKARIAIPAFMGAWPAFWLIGDNITSVGWPACGELDIMEHINVGDTILQTMHWQDLTGKHAEYGHYTKVNLDNYHVYAIEWNEKSIRWFIDDIQVHSVNIANGVNGTDTFHKYFHLVLNLSIGGYWPGFNIDNSAFPAKMLVDYIRVYQFTDN